MTSKTIYTSEKALPYVYRLDNPITGEFYIGYRESNKLPSHLDLPKYKTSSKIVKPRFEEFTITILAEFFSGLDALYHEQLSIFEVWGNPLLLNRCCRHASNGIFKNINHTETFKSNMSSRMTGNTINSGRIQSDEEKETRRGANTGKTRSVEFKLNGSKRMLGNTHSKGIVQSDEWVLKRTQGLIGKPRPAFLSIIETKKTYDKGNLSKWHPEFKQFY